MTTEDNEQGFATLDEAVATEQRRRESKQADSEADALRAEADKIAEQQPDAYPLRPQSGKALRARLSPADRRSVTGSAREVHNGLWRALDACDDLLEENHDAITMQERTGIKQARERILSAFDRLNDGAPDLSGLTPKERP